MKLFSLMMLSFISVHSAHASYYAINCSNADSTISWQAGANSNTISLVYKGFVTGVLELPIEQVAIKLTAEKSFSETTTQICGKPATSRTFAAKVVVTPAQNFPNAFESYFPNQQVEGTVICEEHSSIDTFCLTEE